MGSTAKTDATREKKIDRCPICKGPVAPRAQNPAFPLCSEQCRLIDLGNWLGDAYRVPAKEDDKE